MATSAAPVTTNNGIGVGNVSIPTIGAISPTLGAGPTATAPLNSTTINDLFSAIDQTPEDYASAESESALATGDASEAADYTSAAAIAAANSRLATVAGTVQQAQEGLQIRQTLGTQQSQVAAGGFQEAGSALSLLKGSTQQGLLQQQITGMNAQLQSAGYAEQGTAAQAEASAAEGAGTSATALSNSEEAMGNQSKTNAINEATALGLTIPGISGLSATSIPNANPVTSGVAPTPTAQSLGFPTGLVGVPNV